MESTINNRTNVNRAIQNYIMAVNKANYKNMEAQIAVKQVQSPENAAVVPVNAAANANNKVAEALTNIQKLSVNGTIVKYGKNKNGMWKFAPNTSNNIKTMWVINKNGSSLIRAQPTRRAPNSRAGEFLNSLGNNPSANNLNKVRSIANQANQNVVTSQARQVRSRARAILNPFLLSENDINRLSRNLNSNNSTLKNKAMNKLQNIANTYNNMAIRRMASSKLLEFRKRPINIKIQNPENNTMMNVKWNNNAKKWVLVGNNNKARFNLTNNRNKTKTPKATVKKAPIN